jgi:hypothetical protein
MEQFNKTADGQLPSDPLATRSCSGFPFSPAVEATDIQANIRISAGFPISAGTVATSIRSTV